MRLVSRVGSPCPSRHSPPSKRANRRAALAVWDMRLDSQVRLPSQLVSESLSVQSRSTAPFEAETRTSDLTVDSTHPTVPDPPSTADAPEANKITRLEPTRQPIADRTRLVTRQAYASPERN